jgi:hypothetical protein
MPDVRDQAVGATTVGANFEKFNINTSDAGREHVISATKTGGFLDEDLLVIYRQLTLSAGTPAYATPDLNGPDAFTFAGIGTANGTFQKDASTGIIENAAGDTLTVLHFRIQGTGTPDLTTVDASDYRAGDTNDITLATVAIFTPAK